MNLEDILTLAKAGFTADQISKISKLQIASQPTPPAPPAPPVQPENDFAAQLAALTAAIQANAIAKSSQPEPETVDDILASIINPDKEV